MDDLPPEELWAVVDRAVADLLDEAGVDGPPVDAAAVARHLGLAVSAPGDGEREERRQWSAARSVGEARKPDVLARLGLTPATARGLSGPSLPNLFAGRLLTPSRWLAREASRCRYDLPALKDRFATAGWELLTLRLADLPEPCVMSVVDNGSVYRRKSNGPRVTKALTPAERECHEAVLEAGEASVRRGAWAVRGWRVPALTCERVVLRAVVEEPSAD